jgi:hypothetical protein
VFLRIYFQKPLSKSE